MEDCDKNYEFGNFLHECRRRRGLTQNQLGALVGVSDKAVSKWENGSAMPQSALLFQLSEALGVGVDELLAGKFRSSDESQSENTAKKSLWDHALAIMREKYGQIVPVAVINRYLSEKAEMEQTPMIRYLGALGQIVAEETKLGNPISIKGLSGGSFIAYLLGASEINPLEPHYRCPSCKAVEFDRVVSDGWDLPPKKCRCGKELIRDGHAIPFAAFRHEIKGNAAFEIMTVPETIEQVRKRLEAAFPDQCLIPLAWKLPNPTERRAYVLIPQTSAASLPSPIDASEHRELLRTRPFFHLIPDSRMQQRKALEDATATSFDRVPFFERNVLNGLLSEKTDGISEFNSPFGKRMRNELQPGSFSDLIRFLGLIHGTGVWTGNAQELIRGGIPASKVIAFREDVYTAIREAMLVQGMDDPAFALSIMENARRGYYNWKKSEYPIEELREQLSQLRMEPWLADSIGKILYLFPKATGVWHMKWSATLMWYKLHCPKEFESILQ